MSLENDAGDANNITVVEESDGDNESESSNEFNFAAALSLRKNLVETFDKHVQSNVSEKIARFEKIERSKKPPRLPGRYQSRSAQGNATSKVEALNVSLRVRPPTSSEDGMPVANTVEIVAPSPSSSFSTTIRTFPPMQSNAAKVLRNDDKLQGIKEFRFKHVFSPDTSQHDVYSAVAAPLVHGLFPSPTTGKSGESALLFAYGITNAGKTYTIMGDVKNREANSQWGIIPRALQEIFARMEGKPEFDLYMSNFEIYNEQIYDLLPTDEHPSYRPRPALKLRESRDGQTFVRGLAKHRLKSVKHGLDLADKSKVRRQTSSNNLNTSSSRSHCICQFDLIMKSAEHRELDDEINKCKTQNGYTTDEEAAHLMKLKDRKVVLWIVDLAGSERVKRTGILQGSRQREASQINASLMKLMRCLSIMRENQEKGSSSLVPFRECKLTHLFMSHLGGPSASRTSMVVNVNPSAADFDETQHVLAYAASAKTIQISRADFSRKRKAMGQRDDYDSNGHRKCTIKENDKKRPRKIAQLVKKFSPRKLGLGSKKTEHAKQKNPLFAGPEKTGREAAPNHPRSDDEIKALRDALLCSQKEVAELRHQKMELEEELANLEAQVRNDVVDEMEAHMTSVRAEYDRIIKHLEHQLKSGQYPCMSAKKAKLDNAEKIIEGLMEKVDECEEEMVRMRQDYGTKVKNLTIAFRGRLATKDKQIMELQNSHEEREMKSRSPDPASDVSYNSDENHERPESEGNPPSSKPIVIGRVGNVPAVAQSYADHLNKTQRKPFGERSVHSGNNQGRPEYEGKGNMDKIRPMIVLDAGKADCAT